MNTNTSNNTNGTQQTSRNTMTTRRIVRRALFSAVMAAAALAMVAQQLAFAVGSVSATGPEVMTLLDMVADGQGQAAVQLVASTAMELGGWQAAPGDELVFDRFLSRKIRGASQDFDEMPYDCNDPNVSADPAACRSAFEIQERQVRLGWSFFTNPSDDGTPAARPAFDDLLSTYIEEVGHSWQEYLYETDGRGTGARTRQTTMAESERWSNGREYQVKMYILNLDGTLINLSDEQRISLTVQICEGYASPIGSEVPPFGAPVGWPNPEGWPMVAPSSADFQSFCASY
ncbi:MAG: hypothetical protein JW910_18565 [Anaerolineae bacterium]|nr:hypothetical protein [Anaerolineae bacterium]